MSAAQSDKAIRRWADCEKIAAVLGCGKTHVHDKLYSRMSREELLDSVIAGDAGAIASVKSWPEFAEERPKQWSPAPPAPPAPPAERKQTGLEQLKLTMWFIKQVGGLERAKQLLAFAEQLETELG